MGFGPKSPVKHRPTMDPTYGAATQQSIYSDENDTPTLPDIPLGESFESTTSNSSPTPKGPKGNPGLQRTPSAPPRSFSSQKTEVLPTRTRTAQRPERRALNDMDQNTQRQSQHRRTMKYSTADTCQKNQANPSLDENQQDLNMDADLELSKDFNFTSTYFSE